MRTGIFIVLTLIKFTMKISVSDTKKQNIATASAVILLILTVIFSDKVQSAVTQSIRNCLNVIIPCVFPVTVISFFIIESGFPVKLRLIASRVMLPLFGLSGNCLEGVLLGLTGGYNTAVKCAVKMKEENTVGEEQTKRIALLFTNPGISFTVLLTGVTLTGSLLTGLRIYAETVFYNILIAYIYNKSHKLTDDKRIIRRKTEITEAFISSVEASSRVIISISFNIIIFSCFICLVDNIFPFISLPLKLISEVSTAVLYSASAFPLCVTAGVLTFGGFCIFIQNLKDLRILRVKASSFLAIRIIHAIFVTATEYAFSLLFPESVTTASYFPVKISASDNITGSLSLIFLCLVFLYSVKNIKSLRQPTKKVF